MDVIFFTIKLKDSAAKFLASRLKGFSQLSYHVAIKYSPTVFGRKNEMDEQAGDAVPPSTITFLHTHLTIAFYIPILWAL